MIKTNFRRDPKIQNQLSGSDEEMRRIMLRNLVMEKQKQIVGLLLDLGANINATFCKEVTSLHRAVLFQNITAVNVLLKLGVAVNKCHLKTCTALHLAVLLEDTRWIKHLVELGADINALVSMVAPLHIAAETGNLDIIKVLVEHGANVNACRHDNHTPLFLAVRNKQYDVVRCLAMLGAELDMKAMISSLAFASVVMGRKDILEYLVNRGCRIDGAVPAIVCRTALQESVDENDIEMVEVLIETKADINIRHDFYPPLLFVAMRHGKVDMMKLLVKLNPYACNERMLWQGVPTFFRAFSQNNIEIAKLLLKHGGDVNLQCKMRVSIVHEAVQMQDIGMLKVLVELGADLDQGEYSGVDLVNSLAIKKLFPERKPTNTNRDIMFMSIIEILVEAGIDLNTCHANITALHEAVQRGDTNMVKVLSELGADISITKMRRSPIMTLVRVHCTDIVKYYAEKGADLNMLYSDSTPLHDAVQLGNVKMVHTLIEAGASSKVTRAEISTITFSIKLCNYEMVECLIQCGANVNLKLTRDIHPSHDAVLYSEPNIISALLHMNELFDVKLAGFSPLECSVKIGSLDITDLLLKHGADINSHSRKVTPFEDDIGGPAALFHDFDSNLLQDACNAGNLDIARSLIISGSHFDELDLLGRKPLVCLPLFDVADYSVFKEFMAAEKATEEVSEEFVSLVGCKDMSSLLHTAGIGDVLYIPTPDAREIQEQISVSLQSSTSQFDMFPGFPLKGIGSSAEGTKVGLPSEMDFLYYIQIEENDDTQLDDFSDGYVDFQYDLQKMAPYPIREKSGSQMFHNLFTLDNIRKIPRHLEIISNTIQSQVNEIEIISNTIGIDAHEVAGRVIDTNRKACSTILLIWKDQRSNLQLHVSVDIVPCFHVDDWPKDAITKTWLMDEQELRSHGYVLVPKPPHVKSDLAKKYTEEQLQHLWKMSFPLLETEHLKRLDQRVKDVYLTAKCLRNPDACRILIIDNDSLPRNVDKYITSYLLKTCFLQNVEHFLQSDLRLEEMVCKVYDDLELGLSKGFLPLFFLPKVNVLDGGKLDVPKCAKVAKIMANFVRALYRRDCLGVDDTDQTLTAVYRTYRIS